MNEPFDPLEAELSAMRPRELTPELRRRVEARMETVSTRRWRDWRIATICGLAAACLATLLIWWWAMPANDPKSVVAHPLPAEPVEHPELAPTLRIYQLALARSPDDLNALFDKQSAATSAANLEPVHVCTFMWSEAALHAFLGDD